MRATVGEYLRQLQALLPQGMAWPRGGESVLTALLTGFSGGLARNHNRGVDLLDEADPRTAIEALGDWERICGLPSDCLAGVDQTIQERRNAVVGRLNARGGQSRAFFISLAADLGFEVGITEYRPFTCESECEDQVGAEEWRFLWQVDAPETTIRDLSCESPCSEPLRSWRNELLECAISGLRPAHTTVVFSYGG